MVHQQKKRRTPSGDSFEAKMLGQSHQYWRLSLAFEADHYWVLVKFIAATVPHVFFITLFYRSFLFHHSVTKESEPLALLHKRSGVTPIYLRTALLLIGISGVEAEDVMNCPSFMKAPTFESTEPPQNMLRSSRCRCLQIPKFVL